MREIDIRLLGGLAITVDGHSLTRFPTDKSRALLAYLAIESTQPQSRKKLANLLWPEAPARQARSNLRNTLTRLRRALDAAGPDTSDQLLSVSRTAVQFNLSHASVDVLAFRERVRATQAHSHESLATCEACLTHLKAAAALYRGEFLHGLTIAHAGPFEEWLLFRRESLNQQGLRALADLTFILESQGNYAQAHAICVRLLALDPYQEQVHRQLLRLLARQGMPDQALAQFEALRKLLLEELGVEPDEQTSELVRQISLGALGESPPSLNEVPGQSPPLRSQWNEAPLVGSFFGRRVESRRLQRWLVEDRCQLIALVGMGGMGKSTLAASTARAVSGQFEVVIWRSMLNAPPFMDFMASVLPALSISPLDKLPGGPDEMLPLLLHLLKQRRCLLVLDNAETLLQGEKAGQFRPGYEDYERLLRLVGVQAHQSTLLLTSREMPSGMDHMAQGTAQVRSLVLAGLDRRAVLGLLQERGLDVPVPAATTLAHRYSGNPLALSLVAQSVQELYFGDVDAFLADETPIFDDIHDVLQQQIGRLAPLERDVIHFLAIAREPASPAVLQENLLHAPSATALHNAIANLQRRSLLEKRGTGFGLQSVVTEYLTDYLVDRVCLEIESGRVDVLNRFPLLHAQASEPIRQSQIRLLLEPIARRLHAIGGPGEIAGLFRRRLDRLHGEKRPVPGYAAGNILNLILYMGMDTAGYDFSGLSVWQVWLQGMQLPQVNLAGANLARCTFTGTTDVITSVAFRPDGRFVAAGSADGKVRLWRTGDGMLAATLDGHEHVVLTVAFSPDGRTLASGSVDGTVRLWDVTRPQAAGSGQALAVLGDHQSGVHAVAFSPDGRILASGGRDRAVRLWGLADGRVPQGAPRRVLPGQPDTVRALAFSPDGRTLAGSISKTVYLWDMTDAPSLAAGRAAAVLHGHQDAIDGIAFNPNGQVLATGSNDRTVRLWDLATGRCRHVLQGHLDWVTGVAFSVDGRSLATASTDRTVRLWNLADQAVLSGVRPPHILRDHRDWIRAVAFSPDGQLLASGGDDKTLRLWDVRTEQLLRTAQGFKNRVLSIAFHPNGSMLASGSDDGSVRLWPVAAGQTEATQPWRELRAGDGRILALAFHPGGRLLASGGWGTPVRVWDPRAERLQATLPGHGPGVAAIAFSPDGRLLATGGEDRVIRLWRLTAGVTPEFNPGPHVLEAHQQAVLGLAFSPDSRLLASGSADATIRLWDANSGQRRHVLRGHSNWVNAVAFSPDGAVLASGSADATICLWHVSGGTLGQTLSGHTAWVRSVVFSPDGRTLASGGNDFRIRLWDVGTGKIRQVLDDHQDLVWSVAFSPDGQALASGSGDQTLKLWDPRTGNCLNTWRMPGPYQGTDITGATGITAAQRAALVALGAFDAGEAVG